MLRCIDENLWVAEQPQHYFGLSIGTRMTVIRNRETDTLLVLSPIKPTPELEDELSELGIVSDIVAPNSFHHLYCNEFKNRHPQAMFWGSPFLKKKCPHLLIDRSLTTEEPPPWPDVLLCAPEGLNTMGALGPSPLHELAFCHVPSKTLILTDSAFNFDASYLWPTRLATRIAGGFNRLEPTIVERMASSDKLSVRNSIQKVLSWDFDRVIVAHGAIVASGGKAMLARAYSAFLRVAAGSI